MPVMKGYFVMFVCLLALDGSQFVHGYAVCGNDTYKADVVQVAVDEIIRRFMAFRSPNWGWESMSIAGTIQVAAPKKFFGREKTTKVVEHMIRYEYDNMDLIDIAELAFIARSLCLDPRKIAGYDMLETVHDRIFEFIKNTSSVQPEHVFEYVFVLSCLCINNYPLDATLVDHLINIQNEDGSFGIGEKAVDQTIGSLRPVFCLTRMTIPNFNATRVKNAFKKLREFVIKQLRITGNGAYIGEDEINSNEALVGLWHSREPGEDPDKKWGCSKVMDTLGIHPTPTEDEYHLQERIFCLTATDILDLQSKEYKCLAETDPIPKGYKPKCDYEKPETCAFSPK